MTKISLIAAGILALNVGVAQAAPPPLMGTEWAAEACNAWNKDAQLTGGLAKWMENNGGRGYKIIHMYRSDCGENTMTELKIEPKDGKVACVYGGAVQNPSMDWAMDYEMNATTERWHEMGAGEYGPMKAMMFGRLKFKGPKVEAMSVMGPFEAFLLLPGKVAGSDTCPGK